METTSNKLTYLTETKEALKTAILNKGVSISDEDTFRSYPEKINSIQGGETITKAFLPTDFKGSTALGSTILINPANYYTSIHLAGEHTWAVSRVQDSSYGNNSLLRINDHVLSHCNNNENRIAIKGEDGIFQTEYFKGSNWANFGPYILKNTLILYQTYNRILVMYRVRNSELMEVFSKSNACTAYFNNTLGILLNPNDEYCYTNHCGLIMRLNKNTLEATTLKSRLYEGMMYLKDGYIYSTGSSEDAGRKLNLTTDSLTNYTVEHYNNISTSYLKGLMDGSLWLYMNTTGGNLFTVYKPVLTAAGDGYEFIEDEEKSAMLRDLLGTINNNCIIETSINNDIYIQNGTSLFAFHYDKETEILTQIEHPCAQFEVPEGYWLSKSTVNMLDGWCAANYSTNSSGMITKYAKLETTDLGTLEWVAYEPVKANYIPQSVTAISAGTTGTDENGNNYVEVKKLNVTENSNGSESETPATDEGANTDTQTTTEETPPNTDTQSSNDTETETPTESSGETQPISESTPEETPVSEDTATPGGNEIDTTNT